LKELTVDGDVEENVAGLSAMVTVVLSPTNTTHDIVLAVETNRLAKDIRRFYTRARRVQKVGGGRGRRGETGKVSCTRLGLLISLLTV
jgi:hypothetical protein